MTYPAVNTASVTTTTTSSSGTTHTLTMPASIAAGDLLVAWFEASGISSTSTSIATNVGTWTKVFEVNPSASTQLGALYWKWADGAEDGASVVITVGGSFTRSIGNVFQITGVFNSRNPEFSWNTTNSLDSPSVTASWGGGENLFIALAGSSINGAVNFTAAPTGYTNLTSKTGASSGGIGQASKQSASATDNPSAFTASGGAVYVSATMVVNGVPAQTITSINGGNPITAGQTGIPIVATGFPSKPDTVTATYAGGTKSIAATIDAGGTTNNFSISIQDRIEGEDWPLNDSDVTYTFSIGAASASLTQKLVKKASETVLTFVGAITSDPATLTYWLTQDGFTAEGGELAYIPYGDLVLTADGGGSATDAGTFTSWFRPATGTGAGNVYAYTWVVTEAGISPAGGLTSSGLTSSGLTSSGLTSSGL